ncbi:thylakoid membrane photosystem I accumulation factor [Oscillatoria sp. FACHB-1406]|uniref:thylakoid membrane photosystem I accumulation factor n=1 Tax=Oscillatoria sp. FACHB-1406 TaxID=2692846 RepID=UPI001681E428|nr:thylakoid membrane photosystem I accumulation factor [Oscillatoria sp. FACHB-1406]MBD2577255.1 thylakoid membrane photosystem I accumulation factor [Oscillatoria sp. FACHB-1406]
MHWFNLKKYWQSSYKRPWLALLFAGLISLSFFVPPAFATLTDDRYDGNIYMIYAGNGSLVPSKVSLAESLAAHKPAVVAFYADDSSDCKQYSIVVSRLQDFYGRAASIIPIAIDTMPVKAQFQPNEVGYYYKGFVPQTVIFDAKGKVVFDEKGQVPYEKMDDVLREVFNLVPRTESKELKRRTVNEFNSELTPSS